MVHLDKTTPAHADPLLDPADRIAEILFGVIMVLTFTGSFSVAEAGEGDVHELMIAALGCNIAWGVVDGFMYVMSRIAERRRTDLVGRAIREARDGTAARESLKTWLAPEVVALLDPAHLDHVIKQVQNLPQPSAPHLEWSDWKGAFGVFLLVFLSTLPVIAPFKLLTDLHQALRLSHGVALVMLFLLGAAYARTTGQRPLRGGLVMAALGVVLALMTIALGG